MTWLETLKDEITKFEKKTRQDERQRIIGLIDEMTKEDVYSENEYGDRIKLKSAWLSALEALKEKI